MTKTQIAVDLGEAVVDYLAQVAAGKHPSNHRVFDWIGRGTANELAGCIEDGRRNCSTCKRSFCGPGNFCAACTK